MSESGQGRARGRGGRGRRPQQPQAPGQPQPAAQPATAPPVGRGRARGAQARQEIPPTEPTPVGDRGNGNGNGDAVATSGGRGVVRGGGRERPNGGGNGRSLAQQMEGLSVEGRPRRNPWDRFIDRQWKADGKNKQGTSGNPRQLLCNYAAVTLPGTTKIHQYHVSFNPPIESIKVKCALIFSLSETIGNVSCFDGGMLFITKQLPKDPMVCYTNRTYDNQKIEVKFKYTCEAHSTSPQFLQIANRLLKKVQMNLDMKQIRDHYFNLSLAVKIQKHKLEVMPGFSTSILTYDSGALLNLDIVHKILRMDTFLDCMYDLYNNCRQDQFQEVCFKKYVGTIVLTKHNNKTYKVDDISWNSRPNDTFEKNGAPISYVDYYKQHWNIQIRDMDQPLLITKPTERDVRGGKKENIFLIPELCTITGLSEEARSDFGIMKDLAVHTRIGPDKRRETMENFLNQINRSPKVKEVLGPWNMTIQPKLMDVPARELRAERLEARDSQGRPYPIDYDIKSADWSRAMRDINLLNPVHMESWLMIYPSRSSREASSLADCLTRVGNGMGMKIAKPTSIEISQDRNEAYLQAITQNLNPRIQIVVTVVSNNKKDRYDAIKKSCCIDHPVPSQVVVQRTLAKQQGLMSVATKIAIQMNCKMGGEVWGSTIPVEGLMIVGLDAYHDSLHKGQSVGAMVATLNRQCTRYFCKTEMHESKIETMRNFTVLLTGALKKYVEVNKAQPSRIIVFRDGVGDGQLASVFQSEKEQLDQALRQVGGEAFNPGITYIVVKKRIGTRLFLPDNRGNLSNPQPGTIVDCAITKPSWYDFYLVSQSVRQGTVTPTSYNVLFDSSGLQADHIQRLAYKLTHLYFNWQGTIRVPAPCQYAHKLAFLQGQSLHREPDAYLSDKLFFL